MPFSKFWKALWFQGCAQNCSGYVWSSTSTSDPDSAVVGKLFYETEGHFSLIFVKRKITHINLLPGNLPFVLGLIPAFVFNYY